MCASVEGSNFLPSPRMRENLPMAKSKPGAIHTRIIEVMRRFPEGISGGQIRQVLAKEGMRPEEQTHLDRRKRDLKKWFIIKTVESTQEINGKVVSMAASGSNLLSTQ
jgi:hypothetical protein